MKTIKAFSNKVIDLTDVQDYERITAEFNRLTKDYYTKEKNAIQQLRTLRQIRIRLSLAKKVYEVTGKELDTLVEEAWKIPGVIGSRMTGAGFGGCTVSIVENDAVENFISKVGEAYKKAIGYAADFYVIDVGEGAGVL